MFHPPFNFGLILAMFITGYTMLLRKRHLQDIGNINAKQKKSGEKDGMTEKSITVEIIIRKFRIDVDYVDTLPFHIVCVFAYSCEHAYWASHINISPWVSC